MFKALRERFSSVSETTRQKPVEEISEVVDDSGRRLKEQVLDDLLHDLELVLLEADVALPVAEELTKAVRSELSGQRIDKSFRIEEAVGLALRAAVRQVLAGQKFSLNEKVKSKPPPFVIMFVGINGGGKTTAVVIGAHQHC